MQPQYRQLRHIYQPTQQQRLRHRHCSLFLSSPIHTRTSILLVAVISTLLCLFLPLPLSTLAAGVDPSTPTPLHAISHPSQLPPSKYTNTQPINIEDVKFKTDAGGLMMRKSAASSSKASFTPLERAKERQRQTCGMDIGLSWSASMNTGIYATSLITHLYPDPSGSSQVIVPGFHRELNILDRDGHHLQGSPIHMGSETYFHASPLTIDFDGDGIKDILWINVDGEVFILNGDPDAEQAILDYPWNLPKIQIEKKWYEKAGSAQPNGQQQQVQNGAQPPPAAGRRLFSISESTLNSTTVDEFHPLHILRREKTRDWILKRVVRKLDERRQLQQGRRPPKRATSSPASATLATVTAAQPAGRKLMQSRPRRRRSRARSRHRRDSGETDGARKARSKSEQAPAYDEDEEEVDDGSEYEEGEEEIAHPSEDEPAPEHHDAFDSPMSRATAQAHLDALRRKYREGHGQTARTHAANDIPTESEQEIILKQMGLEMPSAPREGSGEVVDDQEDDEDGEWEEEASEAEPAHPQQQQQPQQASAAQPAANEPDYSSEEVRAALDELLAEDSEFGSNLRTSMGRGGDRFTRPRTQEQQQAGQEAASHEDGEDDEYVNTIRDLAIKYSQQKAIVEERKRQRRQYQQGGDGPSPMMGGTTDTDSRRPKLIKPIDPELAPTLEKLVGKMDAETIVKGGIPSTRRSAEAESFDDDESSAGMEQVADGLPEEARESLRLFSEISSASSPSENSRRQLDPEVAYELAELDRLYPTSDSHVWVDAHVLATPSLVDLTGDGRPELVVAVSYFFDETDYNARPELRARLGPSVNLHKYVAGGIVVADLWSHEILWSQMLDLSTDEPGMDTKAFIYASPTIVDLDGDGKLEIIVGTSLGMIYVYTVTPSPSGHRSGVGVQARLKEGFPIVMGEIQAPIAVADVNSDGRLEMVALDARGNVLVFDSRGREIWHKVISGFAAQHATIGDVDGDGHLDVVVATVSGHVWVMDGRTGESLKYFPLRTEGRIITPVLLLNLSPGPLGSRYDADAGKFTGYPGHAPGLHLVFPSFDGHLYIVAGWDGCVHKLDVGEHAYGMVLASDILGRGKLDLLLTTMNGNVLLWSAESDAGSIDPSRALRSWPSQTQGLNLFVARENYHGLYVTPATKEALRSHQGRTMDVEYVIIDERVQRTAASLVNTTSSDLPIVPRRYDVSFRYGGVTISRATHSFPGHYTHSIPAPKQPMYMMMEVSMMNEHKQSFSEEIVVGSNVHFYRSIKYMVVIPFLVMFGMMIIMRHTDTGMLL